MNGGNCPNITLSYHDPSSANENYPEEHKILLADKSIKIKYFFAYPDADENDSDEEKDRIPRTKCVLETLQSGKSSQSSFNFPETDEMVSFIALKVNPTIENRLSSFEDFVRAGAGDGESNSDSNLDYILLEPRSDEEFKNIVNEKNNYTKIHQHFDNHSALNTHDAMRLSEILLSENKKEKQQRLKASSQRCVTRSSTRTRSSEENVDSEDEKVLLVYPFSIDETEKHEIDEKIRDLSEVNGLILLGDSKLLPETETEDDSSCDLPPTKRINQNRTHYLTICNEDFKRLQPGEYLNDTLIDFWMRWCVVPLVPKSVNIVCLNLFISFNFSIPYVHFHFPLILFILLQDMEKGGSK